MMGMYKPTAYSWTVVGLLWAVALLNYMDRQMLSTMQPFLQADIPDLRSATSFGYLMAIFLWVYAAVSPLAGFLADRVSRKALIIAGLLIWSSVTFGMSYATTFRELYFLRAIMGVSEALYIPAALSLIADYHSDRTRALAIGIHTTGIYAGQALGGFGATVAAAFTWHATFRVFGCVGIAYALVLVLLLKDHAAGSHAMPASFRQPSRPASRPLFSIFAFWVLLAAFAAASLPGWTVKNWLPTFFSIHLHMNMAQAGPVSTTTTALSSLAGVLLGGLLSDRWVQANRRGRVYIATIGLALTIPALYSLGTASSFAVTLLLAICFGIGFGMFDTNSMPLLCQLVPAHTRATAYGWMNLAGVVAGALITGWMGRSIEAGHVESSFVVLSVIVLAAAVGMLVFLHPRGRNADIPDGEVAKNESLP